MSRLPTSALFLPRQRYLRYRKRGFVRSLIFLTTGASKIKYNYLSNDDSKSIIQNDFQKGYKRPANTKLKGIIKHKRRYIARVNNFKDVMKNQALFRSLLSDSYGIAYPSHPWNIVDKSPWPFISGMSSLFFALGLVALMYGHGSTQLQLGFLAVALSFFCWNRDIVREGTFHGKHTNFVQTCLKTGFKYFIASELMLFFSFFWTFYNFYFNGSVETAYVYPPLGIGMDDKLPGIMNLILIMSGCILTFGHVHFKLRLNQRHMSSIQRYLALTIFFGMIFVSFQVYEYCHNSFTFSDSTFGSIFYLLTGCHSLHVIIGVTFLFVSFLRNFKYHTTFDHNLNYILAVWYWHFVDVVWVFLYLKIYYLFHFIKSKQDLRFHYIMYDLGAGSPHFNYFELLLQKSLQNMAS